MLHTWYCLKECLQPLSPPKKTPNNLNPKINCMLLPCSWDFTNYVCKDSVFFLYLWNGSYADKLILLVNPILCQFSVIKNFCFIDELLLYLVHKTHLCSWYLGRYIVIFRIILPSPFAPWDILSFFSTFVSQAIKIGGFIVNTMEESCSSDVLHQLCEMLESYWCSFKGLLTLEYPNKKQQMALVC